MRSSWFSLFHPSCLHKIHIPCCKLEPITHCAPTAPWGDAANKIPMRRNSKIRQEENLSNWLCQQGNQIIYTEKAEYIYCTSNFSYQNCCIHMNVTLKLASIVLFVLILTKLASSGLPVLFSPTCKW